MAVLQLSTLRQLGVAVGRRLGGVRLITAESTGSTTTFDTDDLWGADNEYNGYWWRGTDTPNDGVQARVIDGSVASNIFTLTLHPAVSSTLSGDTAELWAPWLNPEDVDAAINEAIIGATKYMYTHTEDITLHSGGRRRFDIPTTFEMLNRVSKRETFTGRQLVRGGDLWNESAGAIFTVTQDSEVRLFGQPTTKMVISGAGDGQLASVQIASLDLSNQTHIEFGIKVDVAVAASDLILRLSATANGADTDKFIAVPALTVGTETWVRVAMTEAVSSFTPAEVTAIISVALEYNANSAANTIWINTVEATQEDSYHWDPMPRRLWRIDKQQRDLIFEEGGREWAGYALLKLEGGDVPAQLSSATDVTEVPEDYITYRAAAFLLEAGGGGPTTDPQDRARRAARWFQLSEQARGKFPPLVNARLVQ